MDNLTREQRHKNMQNIRSTDTKPELIVAKELRRRGIYFAKNVKKIFGKPDFVFRKKKVVVFVDSDFWHGHKKRCIIPKSNKKYWVPKIEGNIKRDRRVNYRLKKDGWKVVRIWEHDIKKNIDKALKKITKALELDN